MIASPRIIELTSQLSNSIKSSSYYTNNQSRNPLTLLSGYLNYIIDTKNDNAFAKTSSSFTSDGVSAILRQSFSSLLEIDVSNNNIIPTISTTNDSLISLTEEYNVLNYGNDQSSLSNNINFVHLNKIEPNMIKDILRKIGLILGNKRCILFADCCFYDLFSDLDGGITVQSKLGLILVAKEVSRFVKCIHIIRFF